MMESESHDVAESMADLCAAIPPVRVEAVVPPVWTMIEGYEPMQQCHLPDGSYLGWIRPVGLSKRTPRDSWGAETDWPEQWEAIPLDDYSKAIECRDVAAAKAFIESYRPNLTNGLQPTKENGNG